MAPLEIAVFLVVVALLNGLQASSTLWTASYRGVRDNNVHNPSSTSCVRTKESLERRFTTQSHFFFRFETNERRKKIERNRTKKDLRSEIEQKAKLFEASSSRESNLFLFFLREFLENSKGKEAKTSKELLCC
jgi:hypothetical protein